MAARPIIVATMKQSDDDTNAEAALARRFLDLWEDQMARACSDPQALSLLKLSGLGVVSDADAKSASPLLLWQQSMAGMMEFWKSQGSEGDGTSAARARTDRQEGRARHDNAPNGTTASDARTPGTASVAAASGDRDAALGLILERLDTLEKRLATLERQSAGSKAGARGSKRAGTKGSPGKMRS